ncbi:MAG: sulfatase-like hydrolase/transferase [Planctomycetota bacterium]|nr:sulfatase-like hydrolase/transferase [Planctomycetota bacterium]
MKTPKNIVWICADDFAPYVSGAYNNSIVKTPHIDTLARSGILFEQAYCVCPLSTPSNQSSWTGRYPRSIGVTLSATPLPDTEQTIVNRFKDDGFQTAAFGKTHYYAPQRDDFDVYAERREFMDWAEDHPPRPVPSSIPTLGLWRPFYQPASIWLNSENLPYEAYEEDMTSHFYVQSACQFLQNRERDQPFFLHLGLCDTHSPFRYPVEFRGRHRPEEFEAPPLADFDANEIPLIFQDLTDDEKRGIQAACYTSVEYLDKNIGDLLGALKQFGYSDETLLVFTSDHGYMLGQHGRFEKHSCYDPAIQVALIMSCPGLIEAGQRSKALIELVDVYPTILDLFQKTTPNSIQGRSFAPIVQGRGEDKHREAVIVEYAGNAEAAIRTERFKLIYCAGTIERRDGYSTGEAGPKSLKLFDLQNDPDEMINLANDSKHQGIIDELLESLVKHMKDTELYPGSIPADIEDRPYLQRCLEPIEFRSAIYRRKNR